MNYSVSDTAEYGGMTRGPRIINQESKNVMKKILAEIQSGKFANEWLAEYKSGGPNFEKLRKSNREHSIETVGAKLRGMMSWLFNQNKKEEVDA